MDAYTTLLVQIAVKAGDVRAKQRAYFWARSRTKLALSMEAEHELDALLDQAKAMEQPSLLKGGDA